MGEAETKGQLRLEEVVSRARELKHYATSGWVAAASGVYGLGAAIWVFTSFEFAHRNPYAIVSRISLGEYPKQQDVSGYLLAFAMVIGAVWAGWWCWCFAARSLATTNDEESRTLDRALARAAWAFAGLWISAFGIATGHWGASALILWPVVAAAVFAVVILKTSLAGGAKNHNANPALFRHVPNPPLGPSWPSLPNGIRQIGLVFVIPALLYAWLYDGYSIHYRIDLHHEGELLAPWQAIRDGAVPYRDLYLQHGFFQNVGKAWLAEQWYGVSLASLRATEAWLAPLGQIALYFVGLAVFRSWISAILLVLVASVANIPVVDRQTFGLLGIAALALALRHHMPAAGSQEAQSHRVANALVVISGICAALSFFYSAEIGIFTFAACSALLLARACCAWEITHRIRWRPVFLYAVGASSILSAIAIALLSVGALGAFLENTWQQIAYQNVQWGRPFPPLDEAIRSWQSPADAVDLLLGKWFQWYLPVLVYLVAAGCLTLRFNRGGFWQDSRNAIWLLALLAAGTYFASALGRADHHHLKYGSLFMWVWVGIGLEEALQRSRVLRKTPARGSKNIRVLIPPLVFAGITAIYVHAVHHPIAAWGERVRQLASGQFLAREVPVSWPRMGFIRIGDRQFSHLREVVAYIQENTRADDTIFDFSSQPTYYFLANRRNPTRYSLAAYASTPAMQAEVIANLEREKTPLVIYRSNSYLDRLDTVPFAKRNAIVEAYLRAHYQPAEKIGGTVILKRADGSVGTELP